jgi:hypothetical protein
VTSNAKWKEYYESKPIDVPEDLREPYNAEDLKRFIATRGLDEKLIPGYNEEDPIRAVIDLSVKDDWFEKTIDDYFKKVRSSKLNKYLK